LDVLSQYNLSFKISAVMPKIKVVSSSHALPRKKRHLQDYFDPHINNIPTPNPRSLPKYKNIFPREQKQQFKQKK
jgi:hypothetical protein